MYIGVLQGLLQLYDDYEQTLFIEYLKESLDEIKSTTGTVLDAAHSFASVGSLITG